MNGNAHNIPHRSFARSLIYQVCIPNTKHDYFSYRSASVISIGARVKVPFRKQTRLGFVIAEVATVPHALEAKLKDIIEVVDTSPVIVAEILQLCRWIAEYYHNSLSEIIPLALPKIYRLEDLKQPKANKKKSLPSLRDDNHKISAVSLNYEQQLAADNIKQQLTHYNCFLLQGVTGSGKTEVYLEIIAKVLEQGKQVLVLVPEIGLTPQLLTRFTNRFAEMIVVLHSNVNDRERQLAWQLAKDQGARLVIGTRLAIFTPMPALGLIIIDEEHDTSFKQMEAVHYSARDAAIMRANKANIPIILGSATPSLESLYNCEQNKYSLLRLQQKALSKHPLHYQIMDLRNAKTKHGLAPATLKLIKEHLNQDNQVLVFINRRGFAPILSCRQCEWIADCRDCDSHLTLHRQKKRMICHHCGLHTEIPSICKNCLNTSLFPIGSGTQRIYEYLSSCLPSVKLLRIDRDAVTHKNSLEQQLALISSGEAQLIVGTQMLAKGHHFPRLTLAIILDADVGFYNHDFRAMERLGQLLIQVAGRAGRAQYPGQVVIQTYLPHHPMLNLLVTQGYDCFAQALLNLRQQASLPPYHFLALIRAQHSSVNQVLQFLQLIKKQLILQGVSILGPAPAPLARKAKQYRMQLLIKSTSRPLLHASLTQLKQWLVTNKFTSKVVWSIDVDPLELA